MLVSKKTATDLHRELSSIEKSPHFVYVRALITHCALITRKILRNAKLRNHLKSWQSLEQHPIYTPYWMVYTLLYGPILPEER